MSDDGEKFDPSLRANEKKALREELKRKKQEADTPEKKLALREEMSPFFGLEIRPDFTAPFRKIKTCKTKKTKA